MNANYAVEYCRQPSSATAYSVVGLHYQLSLIQAVSFPSGTKGNVTP